VFWTSLSHTWLGEGVAEVGAEALGRALRGEGMQGLSYDGTSPSALIGGQRRPGWGAGCGGARGFRFARRGRNASPSVHPFPRRGM